MELWPPALSGLPGCSRNAPISGPGSIASRIFRCSQFPNKYDGRRDAGTGRARPFPSGTPNLTDRRSHSTLPLSRQSHGELRTRANLALEIHCAMMRFGDPLDNGQSQSKAAILPGTGFVGPEKALE